MKNGQTQKQKQVAKVRLRILKLARDKGVITNKQARKVAKLPQVWFHLNALEKAGLLRHTDYNEWKPKLGRPMEF
jgi:predicted ArsR family transcriptional regulator